MSATPTEQSGFSLLEVLVASTVFSLGLAGLSAMLLLSFAGAADAERESNAASAAASLAEQLRLNPVALDRYLDPPDQITQICTGRNTCTPAQQADYDFRLWQLELANGVPGARALVCHDATPEDGIEGNEHCDGTGSLVIKIFWQGSGHIRNGSQLPGQHRFVLTVS